MADGIAEKRTCPREIICPCCARTTVVGDEETLDRRKSARGLSGGINLALAMIEEDYGPYVTRTVARELPFLPPRLTTNSRHSRNPP